MNMERLQNPILPGFLPDPSICRVGEDFYLVCSSFELCPGVPVFHSRDLVHWKLIGHALSRENGLVMTPGTGFGGIMAPTIRYYDGTFYVIVFNTYNKGNCIVTAADPAGPWSKPHYLGDEIPGIDASLFFDSDGTCYIVGTGMETLSPEGTRDRCIWAVRFDIETMRPIGERKAIWNSALRGAASPESPHIYHIGDWYYLMIAEGGTEHYHAITAARSKDPLGWYEGNPANPVLTHRHLGSGYPIANIGHGDLVELPNGAWACVMLGSRLIDGEYKNLGRETFYCPVTWEREWPLFAPGTGRVEKSYPAPLPLIEDEDTTVGEWCSWGMPYRDPDRFADGILSLHCFASPINPPLRSFFEIQKNPTDPDACVSALVRRQSDPCFRFTCRLDFRPNGSETAGIVLMQAMGHQFRLELGQRGGNTVLRLILCTSSFQGAPFFPGFSAAQQETPLCEAPVSREELVLQLRCKRQALSFWYGSSAEELTLLCEADARSINPSYVGGMAGTLIGMFASGNGTESDNLARFSEISYQEGKEVQSAQPRPRAVRNLFVSHSDQ